MCYNCYYVVMPIRLGYLLEISPSKSGVEPTSVRVPDCLLTPSRTWSWATYFNTDF